MIAEGVSAASLSASRIDSIIDVRSAAISAYRNQEPQIAASLYRQCIALGDSSIIPFYNLACCYGRMKNLDSCKIALQEAVDRGYPDYMELGTDPDLQILQKDQTAFTALWQKAFSNSYGKVMAKLFDETVKQAILKQDTARLRFTLPFGKRTDGCVGQLSQTLKATAVPLSFAKVDNVEQLTEIGRLEKRRLDYADNHFVFHDEYVFELPIPYFDAELSRLVASNALHMQLHTVDHLYSYLDSLYFVKKELPLAATVSLPTLTDSVMALCLKIPAKDTVFDFYEEKIAATDKLCADVFGMLKKSKPITETQFKKLNSDGGDIRFVRLNSLPVRNQFKGLKMVFYNNSNVAIVVIDDRYLFVKGKFKL